MLIVSAADRALLTLDDDRKLAVHADLSGGEVREVADVIHFGNGRHLHRCRGGGVAVTAVPL